MSTNHPHSVHPATSGTAPDDGTAAGHFPQGLTRRTLLIGAAASGVLGAGGVTASASPSTKPARAPLGPRAVFTPPAGTQGWGVKYARIARLFDGSKRGRDYRARTLVATFENLYDGSDSAFPVYRSKDDGMTWERAGAVQDSKTGAQPRWQPALYALPEPFAGFPAGTLLGAGNSIPDDFTMTSIDVFVSTDQGTTWSFSSRVATGGPPIPINGETPVWEPALLLHDGRLICYYTDQRDPDHGQKLVHQISTDLKNWGPVVDDHADPVYHRRPGMPSVTQISQHRWILTWEDGENSDTSFGVAYKIADHPEDFASAEPHLLRTGMGLVPIGSPTVAWCQAPGRQGTIVISAGENEDLFVNRAAGAPNAWTTMPSVVPRSYSRQVQAWDHRSIMTIGGGPGNDPPPQVNQVQFGLDRIIGPNR